MSAPSFGEVRRERCKFGRLTEAFHIDEHGKETPFAAPLCTFSAPDPCPPAMKRAWGGLIEFDRDCAVCFAYAEVVAAPLEIRR